MVYSRQIEGRTLTFIVSGKLWRDSLVMQDVETGTLWSHVTGEALHGPLAGRRLEAIPAVHTRWGRWLAAHPGTLVLEKGTAFTSSRYQDYFDDPDRQGLRGNRVTSRLPAKTLVAGTALGPLAACVRVDSLRAPGAFRPVVLGDGVIAFARGGDDGIRAFRLGRVGESLTLTASDGAVTDAGSGSTWDLARGLATAGPLKGTALEELPVTRAFWFAWSAFYPETIVAE